MNSTGRSMPKIWTGAGALMIGGAATLLALAPTAGANPAPGCSASEISGTVSTVTTSARDYLNAHPGANQAVTAAFNQPRPEAEANLRSYFTANPTEYFDLRGILSPLGDVQRNCGVSVLPGELGSAYSTFMAG
ncbi:heme-binding protein [Mycolicibacterium brumae]|uniref:Hemophore-related protein n=1 Tax=Mycolicibacterium brumae TaxID=85968 RepID=A0A2G5PF33_9MYCO|nr:heme-binding protein [Mycolicibacterium brumae]PIB76623.1 hemophore-related protein [Mycolicibacterium brumae]